MFKLHLHIFIIDIKKQTNLMELTSNSMENNNIMIKKHLFSLNTDTNQRLVCDTEWYEYDFS